MDTIPNIDPAGTEQNVSDFLKDFNLAPGKEAMSSIVAEPVRDAATGQIVSPSDVHTGSEPGEIKPGVVAVKPPGPAPIEFSSEEEASEEIPIIQETPAPSTQETPDVVTPSDERRGKTRDLTGFSDAEKRVLLRMSNDTWAFVEPKLKEAQRVKAIQQELQEAKAAGNAWMHGHEDSYKLQPEFTQYNQVSEEINAAEEFWREQYRSMKAGKPVYDLDRNEKGKLVYGAQLPAGADTELLVQTKVTTTAGLRTQLAAEFSQWRDQYKSELTSTRTQIQDLGTKMFTTVPEPVKAEAAKAMEWIPTSLRQQPEYKMIANLYGYVQVMSATIAALRKQAKGQQVVEGARAQGPIATISRNSNGVVNGDMSAADALSLYKQVRDM